MATWRFYQGLRGEWRWYELDGVGDVMAASDQSFEELPACMENAASVGFRSGNYQVHARSSGAGAYPFGHLPPGIDTEGIEGLH